MEHSRKFQTYIVENIYKDLSEPAVTPLFARNKLSDQETSFGALKYKIQTGKMTY